MNSDAMPRMTNMTSCATTLNKCLVKFGGPRLLKYYLIDYCTVREQCETWLRETNVNCCRETGSELWSLMFLF